ncbi:MAG: hypothetical protein QOH57_1447 [Mycobacterium sp.]|nr:hypothetical protein [Mycobacterium sp.]
MFDSTSKHPPTDTVKRKSASHPPHRDCGEIAIYRQPAISPQFRRARGRREVVGRGGGGRYSHSIVPGGLLVMSSTTRFTSDTSLVIRVEMRSSTSNGTRVQSAVIAS